MLFKRLIARLAQLLYLLIILGAALKVLAFGFALYAEHNKHTIERWASDIVGAQVRFSKIETYWAGVTPRLWVRQLVLGQEEKLILGDALVGMNLQALPWWKENLPINIHLQGAHIEVLRDVNGKTRILGMLKPTGGRLPTYVFLEDASIDLRDERRGAHIHQEHLNVRLVTRGNHSSLSISSREQGFQVRAEIDGAVTGSDWSGDFWAQGHELQTERLLQAYLPNGYLLSNLQLNFQAWSYWEQGQHHSTRVQLDLDEVNLHTPDNSTLKLTGLQGDLLYEKFDAGWKVQLKDFRMDSNAHPWRNIAMAALMQQDDLLLGISRIDLQGALNLLPLLPDEPQIKNLLNTLSPSGMLSAIRINMRLNDPESTPVIRSRFEHLSFQPWRNLPGVNNFSGDIRLQKDAAELYLDTRDARLLFNTLFRQPLPFDRIEGRIEWQGLDAENWVLQADHLIADSPDLQTLSRLRVEKSADNPPIMDVQTDFRNGNGAHAGLYYPAGIMSDKLVGWLDAAIVSGKVSHGSFLFHGPLAKGHFPFHKTHDGHFEVLFDVEDLELAYQAQWPHLTNTAANVRFHNNSLDIQARSARIFDTQVREAAAHIGSLKPTSPLRITGHTTGPMADYFRLLRETPLKDTLADRIKKLAVAGNADLQLHLSIPLAAGKKAPPEFETLIDFGPGATLTLLQQELSLKNLQGQLKVDNQGLFGQGIQATTLDSSISLDIQPGRNATLIEAQGKVAAQGLMQQYPQLALLDPKGAADMNLHLEIPGLDAPEDAATHLRIESTLRGMSINLPEPLGKQPEQPISLRVEMRLDTQATSTNVKYGNILGVTFKQDDQQQAELLANISTLPLRDWLAHFDAPGDRDLSSIELKRVRLEVGKLDASPLIATSFLLDLNRVAPQWKGKISADTIDGDIEFGQDILAQPLILSLDKLHLQTTDDDAETPRDKAVNSIQPGAFPAMQIASRDLRLNRARLGALELLTSKTADTHSIEKLEIHGKLTDISVHGSWESSNHGATTWLKGVINTDNMGRLLRKALNMDFLSGSKTYLSFDLNWPGSPFQPNIRQMQGEAQLDMAKGRFLDFKPGLARILGLVNFDTLTRRLKLDFKDVYQQGMAFDTIMGNFQFDAGLMYTNNLEIVGPSASILIAGSTDLVNETYDQILSVSPRLDATLPVAGAIAGGPAAGLAVLLAQQAFSEKLQKIQRITYSITGTWDDPKITRHSPEAEKSGETSILDH